MLSRKLPQLYLVGFFHCHNTQQYHIALWTVHEDGRSCVVLLRVATMEESY